VILVVATTEDDLPAARARMDDLGATATEVVSPSDTRRLLLASMTDEVEGMRVVALLRASGRPAVLRPAGGPQLEAWTRHTRPVAIAERLTICFAWSEHDRRALPNVVELDPGTGFGSGGHPSTQLLLDELAARIIGGERVLDVGCGSGVLGLCALRLGAASVVGVDIEAGAVEATRRNARLNGFAGSLDALMGPLDQIEGAFEVVVANIGRAALVELAADLTPRVEVGGWLAVSGFSPPQSPEVVARLRPLQLLQERSCGEWSSVVLA
jgi:ribosomal protein L11 methyltransferase